MFGSGNKSFQQNRRQLGSKRNTFKRSSKTSAYADKNVILKVQTKPISKAKTDDVIEKIRAKAKKDKEKILALYVVVFTVLIALFVWVLF